MSLCLYIEYPKSELWPQGLVFCFVFFFRHRCTPLSPGKYFSFEGFFLSSWPFSVVALAKGGTLVGSCPHMCVGALTRPSRLGSLLRQIVPPPLGRTFDTG